jgi:hypothetical protein
MYGTPGCNGWGTHICPLPAALPGEPVPPTWLAELATQHGVTLAAFGRVASGDPLWACMGDCACWFLVDDETFLDRYSLVTTEGACPQHQQCPCHAFPTRKPGTQED